VPDKNGKLVDVVVGPGTLQDFPDCNEVYYGAAIGRCVNRIANGSFSLEGKEYHLTVNNEGN
jgi:aldose 1-epimerase